MPGNQICICTNTLDDYDASEDKPKPRCLACTECGWNHTAHEFVQCDCPGFGVGLKVGTE